MNFNFHLSRAASNNTIVARLRENCRMGCIALGLRELGHNVKIVSVNDDFKLCPRWSSFSDLYGMLTGDVIDVWPAEEAVRGQRTIRVAIKTSVGIKNDAVILDRVPVVLAHEYDPALDGHPSLIRVPFMIHDSAMDALMEVGLFRNFICNDLKTIREHFGGFIKPPKLLGYAANRIASRAAFLENVPDWVDATLYDVQEMAAATHMRWLMGFVGGLALPGHTPKTNLPPLLAMLGRVIVTVPIDVRDTPPLDGSNSIQFFDWESTRELLEDDDAVNEITGNAERAYIENWSPMGQARLLVEKIKERL